MAERIVRTPWGASQDSTEERPGIVFHSTAGHGGYHLSEQRQAAVRRTFPAFKTYAGGPWYEEDSDCAIVVLTFAGEYLSEHLRAAVRSVRSSASYEASSNRDGWASVVAWLDGTHDGSYIKERVRLWEIEHAEDWEQGSLSCGGFDPAWSVSFTRVKDGQRRTIRMKEYPTKRFYTSDELAYEHANAPAKRQPKAPAERCEEYSGAFDGVSVISDADPGL
jgi:hypothetical protein